MYRLPSKIIRGENEKLYGTKGKDFDSISTAALSQIRVLLTIQIVKIKAQDISYSTILVQDSRLKISRQAILYTKCAILSF